MLITEKRLIVISTLFTITGLLCLFCIITFLEKTPVATEEFFFAGDEKLVLQGNVTHIKHYDGFTTFTLESTCHIPVIYYESLDTVTNTEAKQDTITLIGVKEKYKGKDQIRAEKILS